MRKLNKKLKIGIMSILDGNIATPLSEVRDWWDIGLRFNPINTIRFVPDESLIRYGDIVRWTEFIRRRILNQRCNADDLMLLDVSMSTIESELLNISEIQIGWPVMRDGKIVYTIFAITPQHNRESLGILETKLLHP